VAENSKIEWTDHTFNPWIGCTKVGPGCDNCYAESMMDHRYHRVQWGAGNPRQRTSAANWRKPLAWNRAAEGGPRPRVFCASLADVFDNEAPDAWRSDLWRLIQATPNLDWLLLTKRIGNAHRMLPAFMKPFPNLWIGATVVNQEEADRDIPKLLDVPATVRFLSCEPLLGPISFEGRWVEYDDPSVHENWLERIDWIIAGGESGRSARISHPDWFRSLRDQCVAAGVPFFFKQWGEWLPELREYGPNGERADRGEYFHTRVGKKRAGRMLDGRTWDEFPT
jgi:protein gp37